MNNALTWDSWISINEKMGVPTGIEDSAQRIYDETIGELKHPEEAEYIDQQIERDRNVTFTFPIANVKIGDETVNIIKHTIKVHNYADRSPVIASLGVSHQYAPLLRNFKSMRNVKETAVDVHTVLAMDFSKYKTKDIVEFLEGPDRSEYISSIAHELMHEFDHRKRPITGYKDRARYNTAAEFRAGVKPLDDFLHMMYFMTVIESTVRPAQVLTKLKQDGVTKSGFLKAIRDDRTWKSLEDAKNFSVDELINNIASDDKSIERIKEIFDSIDAWSILEGDRNDPVVLAKGMMKLVFINIVNMNKSDIDRSMRGIIKMDPFIALLGSNDMGKAADDMMEDLVRYKSNPLGYYKSVGKHFKREADRVMRKISKLYSMMPDDKDTTEQSIIDRELHQKINNKKSDVTDTEIKESLTFEEFIDESKNNKND